MQLVCAVLGTLSAVLFLIMLLRGKAYAELVSGLDEEKYPLASLYTVGFAWAATPLFSLKGKRAADLKGDAQLLYGTQYAEYYANVAWAQAITLVHLFLSFTFLLAAVMGSVGGLILVAGLFLAVLAGVYAMQNTRNMVTERTAACEQQFPEVISTMAILVNSGMTLRETWFQVADNGDGEIQKLMRRATANMRDGMSDSDAIYLFGRDSNSAQIRKFTAALLQAMERSAAELSSFLAAQSSEMWNTRRQKMLQEGEKASAKLLVPIVLIFVGIIIIVMTAAFAGSLF